MPSWLAEKALAAGGWLRFDRFMELALYDPVHGYYSTSVNEIGRQGDFSTIPSLSKACGLAIRTWIRDEAKALKSRSTQIIELGAGSGQLAETVLRQFPFWERVRYRIVEISPRLQAIQQQRLRDRRVRWYPDVISALSDTPGPAILISNEFVDAFPCRRFIRTGYGWDEIYFGLQSESWIEGAKINLEAIDSNCLRAEFSTGQYVEVHESYRLWLKNMASELGMGSILTLDYGGAPATIYDRRPSGSVRAYWKQQRFTGRDIYLRPGRQDLTADVNFEDLMRWGSEYGLDTREYLTLREFVQRWAPDALAVADRSRPELFAPDGAGVAFKVLHQRKAPAAR